MCSRNESTMQGMAYHNEQYNEGTGAGTFKRLTYWFNCCNFLQFAGPRASSFFMHCNLQEQISCSFDYFDCDVSGLRGPLYVIGYLAARIDLLVMHDQFCPKVQSTCINAS